MGSGTCDRLLGDLTTGKLARQAHLPRSYFCFFRGLGDLSESATEGCSASVGLLHRFDYRLCNRLVGSTRISKPFFLMLHHKAPHGKWEPAKRHRDYLSHVTIPEPETLWEDFSHRSSATREMGTSITSRLILVEPWSPMFKSRTGLRDPSSSTE